MTNAATGLETTPLGPPLSLREEQKQLARRRILSAAQATFAEQGFAAASVESIAARAGVSRPTFYQYFRNKSELIAALSREPSDRTFVALQELALIDEPTQEQLEGYIQSILQHYVDNRDAYETIMQAQAVDPAIYEVVHRSRERFVAVLVEYLQRTRRLAGRALPLPAARVEAMLLEAQLAYFCHLWIDRESETVPKEVVAGFARFWRDAIRGRSPER